MQFEEVSAAIQKRIHAIRSVDTLKQLFQEVKHCQRLAEFEKVLDKIKFLQK